MIERIYLALFLALRRTASAADIAFTGVWLGLLSRDALHRVDDLMYRRRARYRSEAHNLGGLFAWEEAALQPFLTSRPRTAVIGAGGGREVIALHRRGCEVEGFECNQALLTSARRLQSREMSSTSMEWLPRDTVPSGRPPYSLVIVGWGAYTLMQRREQRVAFLRGLAAITQPGTPILISFFDRRPGDPRLERICRLGSLLRRLLGRAPLEPGDDLAPNFVHRFTRDEIADEAMQAGMQVTLYRDQGAGPTEAAHAILVSGNGIRGTAP